MKSSNTEGRLLRLTPLLQLIGNIFYSILKLLPQRHQVISRQLTQIIADAWRG